MLGEVAQRVRGGATSRAFDKYVQTLLSRPCCEISGCFRPVNIRSMGNSICCTRCDDTHGARHSQECDATNDTTARLAAAVAAPGDTSGCKAVTIVKYY